MKLILEIEATENGGFAVVVKQGTVTLLSMPGLRDTEGKPIELRTPVVDFLTDFEGCYTPGAALAVFGAAFDAVLAQEAWETRATRERSLPQELKDALDSLRYTVEKSEGAFAADDANAGILMKQARELLEIIDARS